MQTAFFHTFLLLFQWLCPSLLLGNLPSLLEEALLFLRLLFNLSMQSFHIQNIDAADYSFDFLLDRHVVKDLFIADQGHNLGADLGFDDGHLGIAHQLGRLVYDHLGQSGILDLHPLFIDDQHGQGLFVLLQHLLLFGLFFLCLFAQKI